MKSNDFSFSMTMMSRIGVMFSESSWSINPPEMAPHVQCTDVNYHRHQNDNFSSKVKRLTLQLERPFFARSASLIETLTQLLDFSFFLI